MQHRHEVVGGSAVPALDIPSNEGPVGVTAKEVQQIVLLQRRLGAARLNLGPFLALYVVLLALIVQQYVVNQ